MENFRPISLLPAIEKIQEKLIHIRTTSLLEKYDYLIEVNFAFGKEKGNLEVLKTILEGIRGGWARNAKERTAMFIDLNKAFDIVKHSA